MVLWQSGGEANSGAGGLVAGMNRAGGEDLLVEMFLVKKLLVDR